MWTIAAGAGSFLRAHIGSALLVALAFGVGYTLGLKASVKAAVEVVNQNWERKMEARLDWQAVRFNQQIDALQEKARRESEARQIGDIPRPDDPGCDAGVLWEHAITDAVRHANNSALPAGAAAAADQAVEQ